MLTLHCQCYHYWICLPLLVSYYPVLSIVLLQLIQSKEKLHQVSNFFLQLLTTPLLANGVPQSIELDLDNEVFTLKLTRVVAFLSPHYLRVLRSDGRTLRNATTPHPSCLFRGGLEERRLLVSVPTC